MLLFIVALVYGAWVGNRIFKARKSGEKLVGWQSYVPFAKKPSGSTTNYPTPRSAGPLEWIKDKIDGLRNKRSQSGGYEESRGGADVYQNLNSRGRARGMDDDPWDSRVGGRDEDPYGPGPGGYHEEAELGLGPTPIGASKSYGAGADYMNQGTSYGGGQEGHSRSGSELDPFSDHNQAASLRSVSPRPELGINTGNTQGYGRKHDDDGGNTSPISTRKSIFREDVN